MKLVIATPLYPPEIGGPATYARLLEQGLPARGIEVELVKFSGVRHLPKLVRHYAYYRRVLSAGRNADIILALDPVSVGLPAMRAARKLGKKFVVKIVGDYAWEQGRQRFGVTQELDEFVRLRQPSWFVRRLQGVEKSVAMAADRIIVPSEYLKGIVVAWGVPAAKAEVIYNAMPIEAVGRIPQAVAQLPRPLIVTAGRLVPWKGIDGVIDAVAMVPGASLAVIGEGPERSRLERRAREMLPGRAVFTGALAHPEVLAAIQSASAFVLNSSYEGLSHLLIEALMVGAPIVATRVGGNPEVIRAHEDGMLVPHDDAAALRAALAEALARGRRTTPPVSVRRFSEASMLDATAASLKAL